jgi:uncharacterized repeat protein (TIGR03803 family)
LAAALAAALAATGTQDKNNVPIAALSNIFLRRIAQSSPGLGAVFSQKRCHSAGANSRVASGGHGSALAAGDLLQATTISPGEEPMSLPRLSTIALFAACGVLAAGSAGAATLKTLYSFKGGTDGATPYATPLFHDGALYGTSNGGGHSNDGTIFKINATSGAKTVLYMFKAGQDGANPYAAGLVYQGGVFYGTTASGGGTGCYDNLGCGTVFSLNPTTPAATVLYRFKGGSDAGNPYFNLIDYKSTLYGTTASGGSADAGAVFSLHPTTKAYSVIYSFPTIPGGFAGRYPALLYAGGLFWGVSTYGGLTSPACVKSATDVGCGFVFTIDPATHKASIVYSFSGGADGGEPSASLIYQKGILYGTTALGGAAGDGTIFKITPATHAESVVHNFKGGTSDGATPFASLLYDKGKFYGTTLAGGNAGKGTLFAVNAATSTETILHNFTGHADGGSPGGLIVHNGILYGAAYTGGTFNGACKQNGTDTGCGVIFSLKP